VQLAGVVRRANCSRGRRSRSSRDRALLTEEPIAATSASVVGNGQRREPLVAVELGRQRVLAHRGAGGVAVKIWHSHLGLRFRICEQAYHEIPKNGSDSYGVSSWESRRKPQVRCVGGNEGFVIPAFAGMTGKPTRVERSTHFPKLKAPAPFTPRPKASTPVSRSATRRRRRCCVRPSSPNRAPGPPRAVEPPRFLAMRPAGRRRCRR